MIVLNVCLDNIIIYTPIYKTLAIVNLIENITIILLRFYILKNFIGSILPNISKSMK